MTDLAPYLARLNSAAQLAAESWGAVLAHFTTCAHGCRPHPLGIIASTKCPNINALFDAHVNAYAIYRAELAELAAQQIIARAANPHDQEKPA